MRKDQASSTALLIAGSLSLLARAPETASLVSPQARLLGDWLMAHYSITTKTTLAGLSRPWFRAAVRLLEGLTVPGMMEHYAVRKRALENLLRSETGVRQLVVLGAGFDTLALRWATDFPERHAMEIDHPATQAWKVQAVAAGGWRSPGLRFRAEDLATSPLSASGFLETPCRGEECFWIAEGLLMYFSAQRVAELFRWIHQTSGPGSRVAFTFMEPQQDGRVDFRRSSRGVHLWLAHRREPFAWGIRRENLEAFLAPLGFRLREISPTVTREVDLLNVGEYLALAEAIPSLS